MYDRDYVKRLEREIDLSGSNRFEEWRLSSEKPEVSEPKHQKQTDNPAEKLTLRAAGVGAT